MQARTSNLVVGTFALLFIFSVPALLMWFSGPSRQNLVEHYVRFSDSVAGLHVGSSVLFGGIRIGRVTAVRIDPHDSSLARVDISVDGAVPLYSDSKATLRLQGISGTIAVDISRGGQMRSRKLGAGDEIAARYSSFRKLLLGLPELTAKGNLLMERVSAFFNAQNASMAGQILANLEKLRVHFAAEAPVVSGLRADADAAMAQFNNAWAEFQQTGGNIDKLVAAAAALSEESRNLASAFGGAATNFSQFVEENSRPVQDFWSNGFSQWSPMLGDLHRLGRNLGRLWAEIKQSPARFFFTSREQQGFEPPPSTSQHH